MTIVEFLQARIAEDETLARACNPSPWFFNGYSVVMSQPMLRDHDQWEDEAFKAGHSLEKRGDCAACGKTTCDLYTEDYHRDPLIVGIAAHHGDTAIGKRVADAQHIERHDPARVLAECAAKRAIIEQADEASSDRQAWVSEYCVGQAERDEAYATDPGQLILKALAAVYSGHPDYQKEWTV